MSYTQAENREVKTEKKNRRLGAVLILFALVLMTVSFVLMKMYHFTPAPPK